MYIESDLLYAYLKQEDWLKKYSLLVLKKFKVVTSVITITELEIVSKRDFGNNFANSVLENLQKIKNLNFIDLDVKILEKSVDLRKRFELNIFDALHAASAIISKKDIISTDKIFDKVENLKRIDPRKVS